MTAGPDQNKDNDSIQSGRDTRISVNATLNASGSIAYSIAVVVITPIAIHFLGETRWGIWQLVSAAAAYGLLLNLGLNSAVSFQVSRNLALADHSHLGSSIHNARIYLLAAGLIMLVVFAIVGKPLIQSLVDESLSSRAFLALATSIAITAATLPVRLYASVISGLQRYDLLAAFRIVAGLALLVTTVAGFLAGMGLVGFVAIMSLGPVIPAALSWIACRRLLPNECLRWRPIDFPYFRKMASYSINTLLYTAGTVILFQSMKMIASWRCGGPVAAGHMGLVINLVHVVSVAFLPLAAVLHTRVSDFHSRGLESKIPPLIHRSMSGIALIAIPTVTFLIWEADSVFQAWVGASITENTIQSLASTARWMLAGQVLYIVFLPGFYALVGVGEHFRFGVGMICAGLANAALGWVASGLAPQISSLGAVFGFSLGVLVLVVTAPISIRRFSLNVIDLARDTVVIPLVISAPGMLALAFRPQIENTFADLLVAALAFSLLTIPGLMWGRKRLTAIESNP